MSNAETDWDRAKHVAELASALKRIDWQVGRDQGSQWLAGKLVDEGIRVQLEETGDAAAG